MSTRPETQAAAYMSRYTHSIVSWTSHYLNSLLAESAKISGHLLNLFPAGYCWRGPPCPTLHVQPLFSTQRLDFHSREGAHSLLQHNRSFLPLPYSTRRFQCQTVCCMESPGKLFLLQLTYINLFCSTVLHCLFSLLKDWLETEECWVSMEEGCGWCKESERMTICGFQLETAFISPPLYSKWTSDLLQVFIFYLFSLYANFVCDSISL